MNSNFNDISTDSRYNLVIDILEHAERYDPEELTRIMSYPEIRELYKLLCKTDSSVKASKAASRISVDDEWMRFSERHLKVPKKLLFFSSRRAATIAILTLSSIAAVAIGIAVTTSSLSTREARAFTHVESTSLTTPVETPASEPISQDSTVIMTVTPVLFEDSTMEDIMQVVADTYGVDVRFNNVATKRLHLYFKFNPALRLDEVIEQLNNFEQINIIKTNKSLIVD